MNIVDDVPILQFIRVELVVHQPHQPDNTLHSAPLSHRHGQLHNFRGNRRLDDFNTQ